MKTYIENKQLFIKLNFLAPSYVLEIENIKSFHLNIPESHVIFLVFRLKGCAQHISCQNLNHRKLTELVEFLEENLKMQHKIMIDEEDKTNEFAGDFKKFCTFIQQQGSPPNAVVWLDSFGWLLFLFIFTWAQIIAAIRIYETNILWSILIFCFTSLFIYLTWKKLFPKST